MNEIKEKPKGWLYGQKTELSRKTGILNSHISDIFNRHARCSREAAAKILEVSDEMELGLTLHDLIYNDTTSHPLFISLADKKNDTENRETENTTGNS